MTIKGNYGIGKKRIRKHIRVIEDELLNPPKTVYTYRQCELVYTSISLVPLSGLTVLIFDFHNTPCPKY